MLQDSGRPSVTLDQPLLDLMRQKTTRLGLALRFKPANAAARSQMPITHAAALALRLPNEDMAYMPFPLARFEGWYVQEASEEALHHPVMQSKASNKA